MSWYHLEAAPISESHRQKAKERQGSLTKPNGSLGQLEQLAITLAGMQASETPNCEQVAIDIFAADHGVAAEGVSAFPQSVTVQMVQNFSSGGAAICVLAKSLGAQLQVTNAGTATALEQLPGVNDQRIADGTANFVDRAAMSEAQLQTALGIGRDRVLAAAESGAQLWIGGEMGIANTTSATALACAWFDQPASQFVGPGTGLNNSGQIHKAAVIQRALDLFHASSQTPLKTLQYLGGFEIAALTGAYIACAQRGLPALVDGYICSVAALYARTINPAVAPWLLIAHRSAEPGHKRLLQEFDQSPLLDLGMRLGEGSGAAVAVPLLRLACALHNQMATFATAGVDNRER
ncbi:nicotinate-nucleotide--dimethylbenzimidazole phosphoribosyltransferase [Pseudomaricurvus alkylphenolicus]|uniref:nicotinate-nucleotide--dimethylbenzimidazole phosphoribosyltransferase n=1 Tax=Pseudomaricurvus alkylphenolicus TaxID=1306991 RepID=UPI00142319E0|nr:nicotinate-nucleotide--dimethylbenzimidazole phosphoribosyltransferase [Pseudomaricurvus alkylphenolicus]NIB39973.1 nicotinate-nucleotide--dimethylbenzimidazole phosphoribosyltransferase [Pseudomaricurvus alkylphenolicus]